MMHPAESYVVSTYAMGAVIAAAALLAFVTIFLFKKRLLQIRLCFAQIVLQIGSLVFIAYYAYHGYKSMGIFEFSGMSFGIPAVFPLVSIIFTVLALRAIAKDERLVRSLNRIR